MRIAVIGLGDIATKAYLPLLTRMPNLELIFCTRNPEKLAVVASKYRIAETCRDYRELLKMNIDGVMIHTSSETHAAIATFFIEQHIPVFVDKPATLNFADYQKLHDLSEQKSVPFVCWLQSPLHSALEHAGGPRRSSSSHLAQTSTQSDRQSTGLHF